MTNKKGEYGRGVILSEILIAGSIIIAALAGAAIVIGSMQSMLANAINGFEAQLLARKEIALAHLVQFEDLVPFEKNDGIFKISFSVSYRNAFTANVATDVSWFDASISKHRQLTDRIIDWRRSLGAMSCDWLDNAKDNLSEINFGTIHSDTGNPITDIAVQGDYAYVSANGTVSSLADLYVIDVSDIHDPKLISRLNTGPGIAAIAAAGNYVFAANAGSFQLQVINISDPFNPMLSVQAKLPGSVISGSSGFGESMHFYDSRVYLGLVKNAGPEFYVVDVKDPPFPIFSGSYEIGSTVNGIKIQNNFAAVTTPSENSLFLLDVSDAGMISEIDRISLSGWQTQGAQSIEMLGQKIFVGRTLGGFYSPNPELAVFDRNNFASSSSQKISASIERIRAFNGYLYITTSDTDKAFQIVHDSTAKSFTLSSRGVSLACNEKAMFVVTQNSQDFFHIFSS